jgi:quercetin dioxygenase-like cupin family protein
MDDDKITLKTIRDIEAYAGPGAIPGIRFRTARQALGVSAWGMNVLEIDPHCSGYPEHDHVGDGQEEVYVVLSGSIVLQAGGAERTLVQGDLVRVPPTVRRKLVTRAEGATLLALGGTPGKPYPPPSRTSGG